MAFRDWDGKLTQRRRNLLKELNLKYVGKKGKHSSIVSKDNSKIKISLPNTPRDTGRGNQNLIQDIIDLYERVKD